MNIQRYFCTLNYLKPIQIWYQTYYRVRKKWRSFLKIKYPLSIPQIGDTLSFSTWIDKPVSFQNNSITFLNQKTTVSNSGINWNEKQFGLLWAYNLNYMDFLLQPRMEKEEGIKLIKVFIKQLPANKTGHEPYTTSLRGINWIKFLSVNNIKNEKIDNLLYAQYQILFDNLEYHLLGNHLLENGFSLLFGAFYFKDINFYYKAKQILENELEEQILDDGAHFELSPMYHQIILDRLLDSINLIQNNQRFESQERILEQMQAKAHKMLNWLNQITFSTGQIPLLNDAASGIAPTTQQLNEYAIRLNLVSETSRPTDVVQPLGLARNQWILSESGYRRFNGSNYECIIDIGAIGPSYQPGHAHADTFNFVLNVKNEPVLVDTGISTYEEGITRLKERGTAAHNTVTVQDKNSTEVWSSFRVARRAEVKIIKDEKNHIVAQHDGYKKFDTTHQREWKFTNSQIEITDTLTGKITEGKVHFWLSPSLKPAQKERLIEMRNVKFNFENSISILLIQTQIPNGFNRYANNYKIEVLFKGYLKTIITIE